MCNASNVTIFNGIANIKMLSNVGKMLNSKQAHKKETKERGAKEITLVQVDKKTHFCLTDVQTKRFTRLQNDYNWILSHIKQLRSEFPNKYIAVQNETVRFSADTVDKLIDSIRESQEQVQNFAVEYMSERPTSYLF